MNKTELKKKTKDQLHFWAKKSDDVSHITSPSPGYRVLCGKYTALLGNNYAEYNDEVCHECASKLLTPRFNPDDYSTSVSIWINEMEDSGIDPDVIFFGNPKLEDDGIGPYEFWGAKGVDRNMQWNCEDVTWDESLYTQEWNDTISVYIDKAATALITKYQKDNDE